METTIEAPQATPQVMLADFPPTAQELLFKQIYEEAMANFVQEEEPMDDLAEPDEIELEPEIVKPRKGTAAKRRAQRQKFYEQGLNCEGKPRVQKPPNYWVSLVAPLVSGDLDHVDVDDIGAKVFRIAANRLGVKVALREGKMYLAHNAPKRTRSKS